MFENEGLGISPGQILLLVELGRKQGHFLPWHRESRPFRILLVEILLRRTSRAKVLSVYKKLDAFRTPSDILERKDELRNKIATLGLVNQRMDTLLTLSRHLVDQEKRVPKSRERLKSYPGIGDYIADAVRLYAFDIPEYPTDSGVQRILRRMIGAGLPDKHLKPYKDTKARRCARRIISLLGNTQDIQRAHRASLWVSWNTCRPNNPTCPECPICGKCLTGATASDTD